MLQAQVPHVDCVICEVVRCASCRWSWPIL